MVTEPYPVGTIVNYHGSLKHHHGEHRITGYVPVREDRPDLAAYGDEQVAEWYPDGVTYSIWPVGVPEKFGNRDRSVTSVRRGSITPVETKKYRARKPYIRDKDRWYVVEGATDPSLYNDEIR